MKILEFEEATLATLADDQPRIVKFDVEPLPLLRALAEGRLPNEAGQSGDFEIELTGDGAPRIAGADLETATASLPFHGSTLRLLVPCAKKFMGGSAYGS